jgi:hypothetical protein
LAFEIDIAITEIAMATMTIGAVIVTENEPLLSVGAVGSESPMPDPSNVIV